MSYFSPVNRPVIQNINNINRTKIYVDKTNKILEEKYGIESNIENPEILKYLHNAVANFAKATGNDKLFSKGKYNLVFKERPFSKGISDNGKHIEDNDSLMCTKANNNNTVTIFFNSNINNWVEKNNEDIKYRFDNGLISTDNTNYNINYELSNFLFNNYYNEEQMNHYNQIMENLKQNALDYNIIQTKILKNDDNLNQETLNNINGIKKGAAIYNDLRTTLLRLCNNSNFQELFSNYTASKMCGAEVPQSLDSVLNIWGMRFPKTEEKNLEIREPSKVELNKITEVLSKKYGITAKFNGNTAYAAPILLSVESLTKAAGNKDIFNGLTIEVDEKYFSGNGSSGICTRDNDTGNFIVAFNPKLDFNTLKEKKQNAYNKGNVSTNNIIHSSATHELAHWLQWGYDNSYMYNVIDQGMKFQNTYDNVSDSADCYKSEPINQNKPISLALSAAAHVSSYATKDSGEFCAEYVAGKMDGKKYPKSTDVLFETLW